MTWALAAARAGSGWAALCCAVALPSPTRSHSKAPTPTRELPGRTDLWALIWRRDDISVAPNSCAKRYMRGCYAGVEACACAYVMCKSTACGNCVCVSSTMLRYKHERMVSCLMPPVSRCMRWQESVCESLPTNTRLAGFRPLASYIVVCPVSPD